MFRPIKIPAQVLPARLAAIVDINDIIRARIERMTILPRFTSRLFLVFICVSAIASASGAPPASGRLVILRAPNFGWNLVVHVRIDGRDAANIVQGRRYDRPISAGSHVISVEPIPFSYSGQRTSTQLNVNPGQTYVFTAVWQSDIVYLRPTLLSAAQLAQYGPP